MNVLVADDDPVSRRLLERTLTRLGHTVESCGDGLTAIDALTRLDGPRLAVLDWMMPGADGLAVCRAVRLRVQPYVYILLLSARDRHEDMMAGLDAGADDFLTKPVDVVELRARLLSGERVLSLQEGLLAAQQALERQATHDDLTGLWNRRMVLDRLDHELNRARRQESPLALVLADIDHFKNINDTRGHAAGDVVLKTVASRLRSALRSYDFIGRYGGEEFLILLPGCDVATAWEVAERARATVASEPSDEGPVPLFVTLSLGLASTREVGYEAGELVQAADVALYRAKATGRDRVAV